MRLRLGFLRASLLGVSSEGWGAPGYVTRLRASCASHRQCAAASPGLAETLREVASAGVGCQLASTAVSMAAVLTAAGVVEIDPGTTTPANYSVAAVRAESYAAFKCVDGTGYAAASLRAVQDPLSRVALAVELAADPAAVVRTVKAAARSLRVSGRRAAVLSPDTSSLTTSVDSDIFAGGRGGSLLKDTALDASSSQSQLVTFVAEVFKDTFSRTGYPTYANAMSSTAVTLSAEVVGAYFRAHTYPTAHGFWQFFAGRYGGGQHAVPSDDGSSVNVALLVQLRNVDGRLSAMVWTSLTVPAVVQSSSTVTIPPGAKVYHAARATSAQSFEGSIVSRADLSCWFSSDVDAFCYPNAVAEVGELTRKLGDDTKIGEADARIARAFGSSEAGLSYKQLFDRAGLVNTAGRDTASYIQAAVALVRTAIEDDPIAPGLAELSSNCAHNTPSARMLYVQYQFNGALNGPGCPSTRDCSVTIWANQTVNLEPQDIVRSAVGNPDPFWWSGNGVYSDGHEAQPEYVAASLVGALAIPGSIISQQLSDPLYPMSESLPDVFGRSSFGTAMWDEKTSWIYMPRDAVLATSRSLPVPSTVEEPYSVVINNQDSVCTLIATASGQSDEEITKNAKQSLRQGLIRSSCASVANALCFDVDVTSAQSSKSISISIKPCFTGSIATFKISRNSSDSSQPLFDGKSWRTSPRLDINSFSDLYKTLYEPVFSPIAPYAGVPKEECLPRDSVSGWGVVNGNRTQYYPSCVPTVFFPIGAEGTLVSPGSVPIIKTHKTADASVVVETPDTSVSAEVDVRVAAEFGFSMLCSLGSGNLSIKTCFDEDEGNTAQTTRVPQSPNNAFTFSVIVEQRHKVSSSGSSGVPTQYKWTSSVTLTPGELVWDQLGSRFLSQAATAESSGVLSKMLSLNPRKSTIVQVENKSSLNSTAPYTQYFITMSPVVEGDFIYVPLELELSKAWIPGLVSAKTDTGTALARAMTACPLVRKVKTDLEVRIQTATSGACQGAIGIVKLECKKPEAVNSSATYKLNAEAPALIVANQLLEAVYSAAFLTTFTSGGTAEVVVDVKPELNLNVVQLNNDGMSSPPPLHVILSSTRALSTIRNATSNATLSVSWDGANKEGEDMLNGLRKTGPVTLCRAAKSVYETVGDFTSQPSASGRLPFVASSVGVMYYDLFYSPLGMLRDETCSLTLKPGSVTVDSFCAGVSRALGVNNGCPVTKLADGKLTISVAALRQQQTRPAVLFDTAKLTGVDNNIPLGLGRSGDLLLNTNQSLAMNIDVDVSSDAEVSIDRKSTLLMSSNRVAAAADYKVQFGSGMFTFESTEIHLDAKLRGWVDADGHVHAFFDGNASLATFVTLSAYMECKLKINVAPVDGYALGNRSAIVLEEMCTSGGFADNIADALRNMGFSSYVVNEPTMLWEQFRKAVQSPFGNGILTQLRDPVSFLEGRVYRVVRKALGAVTAANDVSLAMFEASKTIMANKTSSIVANDRMSLQLVTDVLNAKLAHLLNGKLVVPPVDSKTFVWPMRLLHRTSDAVDSVRFPTGPHGNAVFDRFNGFKPTLDFEWRMELNMTWSPMDGIAVSFDPQGKPFSGTASFRMNLPSTRSAATPYSISGRFINMPVELDKPQLSANLDITATVPQAGSNKPTVEITGNDAFIRSDLMRTGHVGEFALTSEDSFPALPRTESKLSLGWGRHATATRKRADAHPNTPSVEMDRITYCAGHHLATSARVLLDKTSRYLDPLAATFGPDGWFMKPIPGLEKLGDVSVMSLVEMLAEMHDGDGMYAIMIRTLGDAIKAVFHTHDILGKWASQFPGTCSSLSMDNGNATIDLTQSKPEVIKTLSRDKRDMGVFLHWGSDAPKELEHEVNVELPSWLSTGSTFEWKPMDTDMIVASMLGENVKLFSVQLLTDVISIPATFSFVVYPLPALFLAINVDVSITIWPPPIVLTTEGLAAAVQSKGAGQFFRSMGFQTLSPSGQKRWMIEASLGLSAGAGAGIFKFAEVLFELSVRATLDLRLVGDKDSKGQEKDFLTSDGITLRWRSGGIRNVMELKFVIDARMALSVRICFPKIGFIPSVCFTVFEVSVSVPVLELTWGGGQGLALSACARINADLALFTVSDSFETTCSEDRPTHSAAKKNAQGGGGRHRRMLLAARDTAETNNRPKFTITEDSALGCPVVAMLPKGNIGKQGPQMTSELRSPSASTPITFGGCQASDIVVAGSLSRRLVLPSCPDSAVAIEQEHYTAAGVIRIGKDHFAPQGHSSVEFEGEVQSLAFSNPMMLQTYEVTGLPKTKNGITLATAGESIVQLSGNPTDYIQSRLSITGEAVSVEARLVVSQLYVNATHITSTSGINIGIPQSLPSLTVEAADNTRESRLVLGPIAKGRQVTAVGSTAGASFRVEAAEQIEGEAFVVGYPNASNQLELHAQMTPQTALVVSRQSLLLQNGPTNTIVYWTGINYRSFAFKGQAGATTHIMVVRPESFSVTRIAYEGVPGSGAVVPVTSCDAKSEVVVARSGAGNVNVSLGGPEGLRDSHCTLKVVRTDVVAAGSTTLVVESGGDRRNLRWELGNGRMSVETAVGSEPPQLVFFPGVESVHVRFGTGSNDVVLDAEWQRLESVLEFPAETRGTNKLFVRGRLARPILVKGSVEVVMELEDSPAGAAPQTPLFVVGGARGTPTNVRITAPDRSASGNATTVSVDGECLRLSGRLVRTSPTAWLRAALDAAGINERTLSGCDVAYARGSGVALSVALRTGRASDRVVVGAGVELARMEAYLGDGDDTAEWLSAVPGVVDFGEGEAATRDTLLLHYRATESPGFDGARILVRGDEALEVRHWDALDSVTVRHSPAATAPAAGSEAPSRRVGVSPAGLLDYEMDWATVYRVGTCTQLRMATPGDVGSATGVEVVGSRADCRVDVDCTRGACSVEGVVVGGSGSSARMWVAGAEGGAALGNSTSLGFRGAARVAVSGEAGNGTAAGDGAAIAVEGNTTADLLVALPVGPAWRVALRTVGTSSVVLIGGAVDVSAQTLTSGAAVVMSRGATARMGVSGAVQIGGGCVRNAVLDSNVALHGGPRHAHSRWLAVRANASGATVPATQDCQVAVSEAAEVILDGAVPEVALSDVGTRSVRAVSVRSAAPAVVHLADTRGWASADIRGARGVVGLDNGEELVLALVPGGGRVVLDNAALARDCAMTIDCSGTDDDGAEEAAHTTWNVTGPSATSAGERLMETRVEFNGSACSGAVSSRASLRESEGPRVRLVGANDSTAVSIDVGSNDWADDNETDGNSSDDAPLSSTSSSASTGKDRNQTSNATTTRRAATAAEDTADNESEDGSSQAAAAGPEAPLVMEVMESRGESSVAMTHRGRSAGSVAWPSGNPPRSVDIRLAGTARAAVRLASALGSWFREAEYPLTLAVAETAAVTVDTERGLGASVLFAGARVGAYDAGRQSFGVTGEAGAEGECFDPCYQCTRQAWATADVQGEPCRTRDALERCEDRRGLRIVGAAAGHSGGQASATMRAHCGRAAWAPRSNATCSFTLNAETTAESWKAPASGRAGMVFTAAVSALLTLVGAGATAAAAAGGRSRGNEGLSRAEVWGLWHLRGVLADHFSWASLALTACVASTVDADGAGAPSWGWLPSSLAVLTESRRFVLGWFCDCPRVGSGSPGAAPIVVLVAGVAAAALWVATKVLWRGGSGSSDDKGEGGALRWAVTAGLRAASGLLALFVPAAVYAVAFLPSVQADVALAGLVVAALSAAQLVDAVARREYACCAAMASHAVAMVAVLLSGTGESRDAVLALVLVALVLLAATGSLVFVGGAVRDCEGKAQAVLWSAVYVALRLVSCAFGIAFVASAWRRQGGSSLVPLWALWVWTPFLCVIPVIMTKLGNKDTGK
eukprot:m51a1_g11392 hypothetical protein (3888) ;mRNA; f:15-12236